ncbi:MAG: hypothetical protein ABJC74_06310 [Gemmatimonadota bacterium]
MTVKRTSLGSIAVAVAASMMLAACGSNTPAPGTVYAVREPPPRRTEIIVTRPGPDYVWIGGDWRWNGSEYEWAPGRWAPIEGNRRAYRAGHWAHTRRGWYWVEGRWR